MKKIWWILVVGWFFWGGKSVLAQEKGYVINSFRSEIRLEQDTSIRVKEIIEAEFLINKRGIIRAIPQQYSSGGKTINAKLRNLSVKKDNGERWQFSSSRNKQNLEIKIGREDVWLSGKQTYVIEYEVDGVVLNQEGGKEIYWNVTGNEWDTVIKRTEAGLISEYGNIEKTECYTGFLAGRGQECEVETGENKVEWTSLGELGNGKGMTVVAKISGDNQLIEPSIWEKGVRLGVDNWGYVVAILPILAMGYFWNKKGRDRRFLSDNVFYVENGAKERKKKIFEREALATVYQKIEGLTPAQVGVMIDEKVDLPDIIAEIVELARRGFIKIEKIEKKGLFGKMDYKIIGGGKKTGKIEDYQRLILIGLFGSIGEIKTNNEVVVKNGKEEERSEKKTEELVIEGEVKISELKNKFYVHLPKIKEKIEESLVDKKCFSEKPSKTLGKWLGVSTLFNGLTGFGVFYFGANNFNYGPVLPWVIGFIPSFWLATKMVAKTALGYNYYRQAAGLRWFLEKGKWREEIAEKNLFFGEVLPLAIALGVVDKLSKEMSQLGVEAPEYFAGVTTTTLGRDLNLFSTTAARAMTTTPSGSTSGWSSSGRSSWSGGGGFSGGSSGGGFGGGGGSSW